AARDAVWSIDGGAVVRIAGKFDPDRSTLLSIDEIAPGVVVTGHGDGAIRRIDLAKAQFERVGFEAHGRVVRVVSRGLGGAFHTTTDRTVVLRHVSERKPRGTRGTRGWVRAVD